MGIQEDLEAYQDYRGISPTIPSDTVRNALLLKGSQGNAIASSSVPDSKVTPTLEIIENTGSTAIARTISNAKLVSIFIKSGSGTVLGASVDEAIAVIELPYVKEGWTDINYTVNPDSTFIVLVGE